MRIVQGFAIYDYIQILHFLEPEISECYHYGNFIEIMIGHYLILLPTYGLLNI